jgi:hypothetical protein
MERSEGKNTAINYDSISHSPALYFSWNYFFSITPLEEIKIALTYKTSLSDG